MTSRVEALHRLEPEPDPAVPTGPQVLKRLVITPVASPWEQARAARLDARLGAPLPLAELSHQVKRLEPWRPHSPGRFAVVYVRTRELSGPFETQVEVEGQSVRVAFGTAAVGAIDLRGLAGVALFLAMLGGVTAAGLILALQARSQGSAQLEAAESLAVRKASAAQAYRRQRQDAQALAGVLGRAQPLSAVIGDLTWVATSKAPDARLAAVHWQAGGMAVEVRGPQVPFAATDRRLLQADKPLRPGVWLWGIGPGPGVEAPRVPPAKRARP